MSLSKNILKNSGTLFGLTGGAEELVRIRTAKRLSGYLTERWGASPFLPEVIRWKECTLPQFHSDRITKCRTMVVLVAFGMRNGERMEMLSDKKR
jgi:hypothetical protein